MSRRPPRANALGVLIGHWTDAAARTGCTVVLCPRGAVGGVAVRGGAPCTRETDILAVTRGVEPRAVHGVLLTGGSVFGLAACDGVVRWLHERAIGLDTGLTRVPIVPAAGLYDLAVGDARRWPDAAAGYAACEAAVAAGGGEGAIGAGAGATVGKAAGMAQCSPGGLGIARRTTASGVTVEAIVAVNAFGEVIDPVAGRIVAGVRSAPDGAFVPTAALLSGGARPPFGSTTIGVLVTDAALTREDATELAGQAHDGLAHVVRPAHARIDGDAFFVLATGRRRPALSLPERLALQQAATEAVAAAIVRGVRATVAGPHGRARLRRAQRRA